VVDKLVANIIIVDIIVVDIDISFIIVTKPGLELVIERSIF